MSTTVTSAELRVWEPLCRAVASQFFVQGSEREDVMQEARLGVVEALEAFRPIRGELEPFVRMVVKRRVLDAVTAANRLKHRSLTESERVRVSEDGEEASVVELMRAREADAPDALLERKEEIRELGRLVRERLTDREYEVLIHFLYGESYAKIGLRLGIAVKSVDAALNRVRWKLAGHPPPSMPHLSMRRRGDQSRCSNCGRRCVSSSSEGWGSMCNVCRVRLRAAA